MQARAYGCKSILGVQCVVPASVEQNKSAIHIAAKRRGETPLNKVLDAHPFCTTGRLEATGVLVFDRLTETVSSAPFVLERSWLPSPAPQARNNATAKPRERRR
ncbi:MAG: hypothetical protein IPM46_00005 [Flavobacteriales bacterium]|nr:hypothetical protein [Flavobacteriales bacterium]